MEVVDTKVPIFLTQVGVLYLQHLGDTKRSKSPVEEAWHAWLTHARDPTFTDLLVQTVQEITVKPVYSGHHRDKIF